ncbi:MAG: hypothetical protein EOP06_19125 [Proteobacteria bacterium]|nr:MAG: hypothetical protein EOP06_19125 [Pseudomonadota bacterium]
MNTTITTTTRSCVASQNSIGRGPSSLCVENTASGGNLATAMNNCGSKNMKICSTSQYALICATAPASIATATDHWTADGTIANCSGAIFTTTTTTTLTDAKQYRCCK